MTWSVVGRTLFWVLFVAVIFVVGHYLAKAILVLSPETPPSAAGVLP